MLMVRSMYCTVRRNTGHFNEEALRGSHFEVAKEAIYFLPGSPVKRLSIYVFTCIYTHVCVYICISHFVMCCITKSGSSEWKNQ